MRVGAELAFPVDQDSFVLLPRMVSHSLEVDGNGRELLVEAGFSDAAWSLRHLRAGEGEAGLVTACGAVRASYGGPLDLFDTITEPIVMSFSDTPALRASFQMLVDELSAPAIGTRAIVESLLKQCLVLLLRRQAESGWAVPWLAALKDPHLAAAISAMVERPEHSFSLEDLAVISGLRRSAFVSHFHAAFQKSPIAFLREVRLRLAARLLRTTGLPVKVVATRVGYSSRSYFSRAFAEHYGVDPTRFRHAWSLEAAAEIEGLGRTDAKAPPDESR